MDRGYIEKHNIERIVLDDGLTVTSPLYIKLDAVRRGFLRRKFDHMVEVMWIEVDGHIRSRRCLKNGVKIIFRPPEIDEPADNG